MGTPGGVLSCSGILLVVLVYNGIAWSAQQQEMSQIGDSGIKGKPYNLSHTNHAQLNCDAIPRMRSLESLKSFLGMNTIYRNLAIDCNVSQTKKVLAFLDYIRHNASQLELPRVNIILFKDLALSVLAGLYKPTSLIQVVVTITSREMAVINTKPSQCTDCCVQSTVTVQEPRIKSSVEVGVISQSCRYTSRHKYSLSTVRALEGVHLVIAAEPTFPFVIPYMENGTLRIKGYCGEILQALVERCHFSYTIVGSIDGAWGARDEKTREWNGLVGMVIRKQADLVLTGLTISKARSEVVDFSFPFWEEPSAIVVRTWDKKESYFYKSFQGQVWLVTFACFAVATLFTWFFDTMSIKLNNASPGPSVSYTFMEILLVVFSTALLKGEQSALKGHTVRVLWVSFWLVSLVIVTTYTGNLVAALTTKDIKLPFRTLEELAQDTEYTLQVPRGSVHMTLLQEAKTGIFARLWQKVLSRNSTVKNEVVGIQNFISSSQPITHIGDKTGIEQQLYQLGRCDWTLVPEQYLPSGYGMALPKGTPYEPLFSKQLMSMAQHGLYKRWKQKSFLRPQCEQTTSYGSGSITVSHIQLFFFIIIGCLGVSLAILCMEIMLGQTGISTTKRTS